MLVPPWVVSFCNAMLPSSQEATPRPAQRSEKSCHPSMPVLRAPSGIGACRMTSQHTPTRPSKYANTITRVSRQHIHKDTLPPRLCVSFLRRASLVHATSDWTHICLLRQPPRRPRSFSGHPSVGTWIWSCDKDWSLQVGKAEAIGGSILQLGWLLPDHGQPGNYPTVSAKAAFGRLPGRFKLNHYQSTLRNGRRRSRVPAVLRHWNSFVPSQLVDHHHVLPDYLLPIRDCGLQGRVCD